MIRNFQTPNPLLVVRVALAVAAIVALSGCGLQTGYAPREIPVHRGRGMIASPVPVDSLTVVSWNIAYGENVETALAELRAHPRLAAADIVLLQEMEPSGSARVADALGFHYVHGSASVSPHHGRLFGNAVLSRWPIVGDDVVILPHETLLTGHRRIAVAADIDLGGGRTLRAVSVHTATMVMDQDKRQDQARAIGDSLSGPWNRTIIGGDFNTINAYEATELRQIMRRLGQHAVRLPDGPTISNRFKKLPGSVPVLDHFFCRGLTPGATGIATEATASDHYPIWAVFRLANEE
jgi:endonuclease/exonuclease/phosphatase family metal-dependent hydrolase